MNEIIFNEERLGAFEAKAYPGKWKDKLAANWMRSAGLPELGAAAVSEPLSRQFLKDISADEDVSDRDVLWAILAWGGMRRDSARRLAENQKRWEEIIGALRRDGLDRQSSYELCAHAVSSLRAGGIGPAYYTKLIFFANPRHDGYIMDQWTSRSVNFLVDGPNVVRMRTRNHVDPRNDASTYERFCLVIEELARQVLKTDAEEVEQCLFSTGGKSPAPWRRYLLEHGG